MARAKISVSVDDTLLEKLDRLVENDTFESRSDAFERAVRALHDAEEASLYERELAALDPSEERAWAELGMGDYAELVGRAQ
jgi:metal-responsive CopG/Arc/MetJ family transcriptional regulator